MAKRKMTADDAEIQHVETDMEIQNVEPDAQHTFLVMDRIGPLEVGGRAGQYLEAGERAFESDFAPDSIVILVERGILVPAGGVATDVVRADAAALNMDAEGNDNGTDDSNGN